MSAAEERCAALRDLLVAIGEIAAPPYPEIGTDRYANDARLEQFRNLQRERAHEVAAAARHVGLRDRHPEVIRALAEHLRAARAVPYPVDHGDVS